ncbi:MAG: GMC oxidoreductase [Candidatus Tumulicola sp.]
MTAFDFIVLGSGASGAMAAETLLDGGARVLMLDGGMKDDRYSKLIPAKSFVEIRRTEEDQFRYFLGDHFESAAYRKLGVGAQLTPPRCFIVDCVDELLPVRSATFAPLESLALGGLASGWGLMCGVYSDAELELASLPAGEMHAAYQVVSDRIGISGGDDDARPYTTQFLRGVQPPLPLDPAAAIMAARYAKRRQRLNAVGYSVGRPALALLSQPKDDRHAADLYDMEFYGDGGGAAWRPGRVIDGLRRNANFSYVGNVFATRFEERDGEPAIFVRDPHGGGERRYACRKLVLASGVLGTARIVLRSVAGSSGRLPLLCNDYTYVPCLVPERIGRSMPERSQSLTQLALFHDPQRRGSDIAVGTIFSYRSLLLFRLLREIPLNVRDARILMQYLLSGLVIAGFDHPQAYSEHKALWLETDPSSPTSDCLAIEYRLTETERRRHTSRERGFARVLRTLGAWPVKRVHPPLGSSIHYAGTLPFSDATKPLHLSRDGRLHGTENVFVADASGFTFLPAKPVTLSLMANAHRVARLLVEAGVR